MSREYVTVSITVEVQDEEAFREAAKAQSLADGESVEEATRFLDPDDTSLGDCAVMLFDKASPNGCQVTDTTSEEFQQQ